MGVGWRSVVIALAVGAAWFPATIHAQRPQQLGKIIGHVRVMKGDFPSVPVLVTLEFRGSPIQSAYCDDQGRFGFVNLVANEYRVSVDEDAYAPVAENVNVNPEVSPINFLQLTLVARESKKKEDPARRVAGSNPYLIDPADYNKRFPKKAIKEYERGVDSERKGKSEEVRMLKPFNG